MIDLDKTVLGKESVPWRNWIRDPANHAHWELLDFLPHPSDVNIPVFHQCGWFDGNGIGIKLSYLRMAAHQAPYQKPVLGPWTQTDQSDRSYAGRDLW